VAHVALGSNLGDRAATILAGLHRLDATPGIAVVLVSQLIETAPEGAPGQNPYLNGAAELRTLLTPRALLDALLAIERQLGRERRAEARHGPRTLDLDLLLFGDAQISEPGLIVPHPRMHLRRFVLEPLAELAPEAVHPVLGESVRSLLAALDTAARPRHAQARPS
jgi:2-amino-4-hydroxy-6-hydroxymethyldihydropteridine diphosphokinase